MKAGGQRVTWSGRAHLAAAAALAALALALPAAAARDGIGDGTGFLLPEAHVHSLVVLPRGEIVAAGTEFPGGATIRVWRVSADGAYLIGLPRFSPFRCSCS